MPRDASELARRLARDAEAVCRHYLSNGRRQGRYWTVGDVRNTPGRSMFVRLSGPESGPGAAGHWTDAASAEYGDLLDVIRESCGFVDFRDVADEARRFLESAARRTDAAAQSPFAHPSPPDRRKRRGGSSPCRSRSAGTLVETYLRNRGIKAVARCGRAALPSALLLSPGRQLADRDLAGDDRRRHRSFRRHHRRASHLACAGRRSARRRSTRRDGPWASLLGHAVRFGAADDVLAAGEGIETMLSLRCALPAMPMAAALSANHLAAILFPPTLRRLYIARDADAAGDMALAALTERAEAAGIEALALSPRMGDFNEDLRAFGLGALRAALRIQLAPQDECFFHR